MTTIEVAVWAAVQRSHPPARPRRLPPQHGGPRGTTRRRRPLPTRRELTNRLHVERALPRVRVGDHQQVAVQPVEREDVPIRGCSVARLVPHQRDPREQAVAELVDRLVGRPVDDEADRNGGEPNEFVGELESAATATLFQLSEDRVPVLGRDPG